MSSFYLGIDNGVSGGLALIGSESGTIKHMVTMPTTKSRKGNEVDVSGLAHFVQVATLVPSDTTVVIEEPGGSKSAMAAASMAHSFGVVRGFFSALGYKVIRITPQEWQKSILKCRSGDTKKVALTRAKEWWPKQDWRESERCRIPHDGMVDAALIAEYGRRSRF